MSATDAALDIALRRLAQGSPAILAGGTDFYPALGEQPLPDDVLDISGIAALRGIRHESDAIVIGAGTTWADILRADLPPAFDALRAAARDVGSVQIQSRGTIAGNLCTASPAADGVPPLLALNASVTLASLRGRRILPIGEWLIGPRRTARAADELLIEVCIPRPLAGTVSRFCKLGARRYLVISIAMLAINLRADAEGRAVDTRIAVGSCSPVAVRLPALEAAIDGVALADVDTLVHAIEVAIEAGALQPLSPIDDVRASADYRRAAVASSVRRLALATAHDATSGAGNVALEQGASSDG